MGNLNFLSAGVHCSIGVVNGKRVGAKVKEQLSVACGVLGDRIIKLWSVEQLVHLGSVC